MASLLRQGWERAHRPALRGPGAGDDSLRRLGFHCPSLISSYLECKSQCSLYLARPPRHPLGYRRARPAACAAKSPPHRRAGSRATTGKGSARPVCTSHGRSARSCLRASRVRTSTRYCLCCPGRSIEQLQDVSASASRSNATTYDLSSNAVLQLDTHLQCVALAGSSGCCRSAVERRPAPLGRNSQRSSVTAARMVGYVPPGVAAPANVRLRSTPGSRVGGKGRYVTSPY